MSKNYQRIFAQRKQSVEQRLENPPRTGGYEIPVITGSNIHLDISERCGAISFGGLGLIHTMVNQLGLREEIDDRLELLKRHLPYHESDHVLNIAYNIIMGGTRLEDIELRRNDECFLDAIGADRIPDPTTTGDFTRRFATNDIHELMDIINTCRQRVWEQQPQGFLEMAYIDGDGTMASTFGECKEGMALSYKGTWGYHPLLITLANTKEVLYVVNRPGNVTSSEGAAEWFDRAIDLVTPHAGSICLRGDTDFSQTKHLDRWNDAGVKFIFGYDAMPNLKEEAESLPAKAWEELKRKPKYEIQTKERRKPERHKEKVVEEKGYKNIKLKGEDIAEFDYQPGSCDKPYRMIVVRKNLTIKKGEEALIDDIRYFFYITNRQDLSKEEIVGLANQRCDQENIVEQSKNGVHAMNLPVDNVESNWAYMVMALLAWNLKAWVGLLMPDREKGNEIMKMEYRTFLQNIIQIPTQIIKTGRKIVYRFLSWNRWMTNIFDGWERIRVLKV